MRLAIAIPASLVSNIPHLREKTSHLGMVGRALAIFRVNEAIVYFDRPYENQRREAEIISTILSYMETPQYLRKDLYPKMPILRYVGILPPLRTSHHPLTKKIADLKDGEVRDGVIVQVDKEILVNIGVEYPIHLSDGNVSLGQRITVKITKKRNQINMRKIVRVSTNSTYWGFKVNITRSLGQMLQRRIFNLTVLTSKYGKPLTETIKELRSGWKEADNVLVAFGSPKQGLKEILQSEGVKMGDIDALVVNTIPKQGTETVRTEEAIYATLAVINTIAEEKKNGS